jgi:hypothetical protein
MRPSHVGSAGIRALAGAIVLMATSTQMAIAHAPTKSAAHYIIQAQETFAYDASVPGWLSTELASSPGDVATGNNAQSPRFFNPGIGSTNTFEFKLRSAHNTAECPGTSFYYACTDYDAGGQWFYTNFAANSDVVFCQMSGASSACLDVRRVAIHELGHAAGLSRKSDPPAGVDKHSTESPSNSVMQANTPMEPNAGSLTHAYQVCDLVGLEFAYGLLDETAAYPNCVDHIPGESVTSLVSTATVSSTSWGACIGQVITVPGRLSLKSSTNYGVLSNQALTGRTLWFDRKPHTGSTWTLNVTSTSAATGLGNNWSKAFSTGSTTTISYDFRGHYLGESPTVAAVYTPTFTLTWTAPAC